MSNENEVTPLPGEIKYKGDVGDLISVADYVFRIKRLDVSFGKPPEVELVSIVHEMKKRVVLTDFTITCDDHKPVQHRDRRPPWCNKCGCDIHHNIINHDRWEENRIARLQKEPNDAG